MINDIKESRKKERGRTLEDEDEAKRISSEGKGMRNM
jgi:hypothetical protein